MFSSAALHPNFWGTVSLNSLNPDFMEFLSMAGHWVPEICLPLPAQLWNDRYILPPQILPGHLGVKLRFSCLRTPRDWGLLFWSIGFICHWTPWRIAWSGTFISTYFSCIPTISLIYKTSQLFCFPFPLKVKELSSNFLSVYSNNTLVCPPARTINRFAAVQNAGGAGFLLQCHAEYTQASTLAAFGYSQIR